MGAAGEVKRGAQQPPTVASNGALLAHPGPSPPSPPITDASLSGPHLLLAPAPGMQACLVAAYCCFQPALPLLTPCPQHSPFPPPAARPFTPQTAGYAGLLVAAPTVLYEIIAYVVPGLTKSERTFLAPIVFGSSILFYFG